MTEQRMEIKPTRTPQVIKVIQGRASRAKRNAAPPVVHTRIVIVSRWSLWALIAVMILAVAWIASVNNGKDGARIVFSNIPQVTEALQTVMDKPRYQGMDERNQPFTVVADKAIQKDEDTVALENIRADMIQNDGTWLALNSGTGEMKTESKQMTLEGGVQMFYEGGYEFRTDHAQVDIRAGTAYGDAPVEGQGPAGTLKADSFSVAERGKIIRFNGSVRMTLYP